MKITSIQRIFHTEYLKYNSYSATEIDPNPSSRQVWPTNPIPLVTFTDLLYGAK